MCCLFLAQNQHARSWKAKKYQLNGVFNTICAGDSSKRFNDLVLTLLSGYFEVPLKGSERARTDLPFTSSDLKSHTELIHPLLQIPACICILL